MRHLFLATFIFSLFHFSSAACEETFANAEKGFQVRWQEFQEGRQFPLWTPNWKEEELKGRFDQMESERWQVYFTNPEDCQKPNAIGIYKPSYESPNTFPSWGSRYPYSGSFNYNHASDRYNASLITLHGKQFIALEGPTQENVPAFLHVLDQYQVTDLVRLTPATYKNRENSTPYWEGHINIHPKNGRTTLELNGKEINYFFTDSWINHNGIEPERLIALVKAVMGQETEKQIIAVHCRAGVGRTGTFLAAYTLIRDIDQQIAGGIAPDHIQVSIDKIVWEICLQRPFMVTHFAQYKTLYELVNRYIEDLKAKPSPTVAENIKTVKEVKAQFRRHEKTAHYQNMKGKPQECFLDKPEKER